MPPRRDNTRDDRQDARDDRQDTRDNAQEDRDSAQHVRDIEQARDNQRFKDFLDGYAEDREENRHMNQEILNTLKTLTPMVSRHEIALFGEKDAPGALKRLQTAEKEITNTKWQAAMGVIGFLSVILAGIFTAWSDVKAKLGP